MVWDIRKGVFLPSRVDCSVGPVLQVYSLFGGQTLVVRLLRLVHLFCTVLCRVIVVHLMSGIGLGHQCLTLRWLGPSHGGLGLVLLEQILFCLIPFEKPPDSVVDCYWYCSFVIEQFVLAEDLKGLSVLVVAVVCFDS